MNFHSPAMTSLLFVLSLFEAQAAHAGMPAGEVTQLSGFVMAVKANGALKVLSPQSVVEAGDTLMSEDNTYVRIGLADGRQAVLGPQTRLTITSATALNLATGQLQVIAAAQPGAGRLSIEAGENTVDAGTASFNLFYRPDPAAALAQRAYARASLASAASPVQSDAGTALPVWDTVAQLSPSLSLPKPGTAPPLSPGLYVHVIDGLIQMKNPAGSQNFSAGQFGFTPSIRQPPVILPANPGMLFTPPPAFSSSSMSGGSGSMGGNKSNTVDCEVR
jgi:hypothetical protein